MIWNTLVSSSLLMESRFLRLIQAPLMLEPTKWCWAKDSHSSCWHIRFQFTCIFNVMFGLLQRIVFTLVPNTLDSLLSVCISLVSMIRLYLADRISLYQTSSFGPKTYLRAILNASTGLPPIT